MDKNKSAASAGGVSSTTVLQIVFLVLKLTKLINWSWFWVLSPTIFSAGLLVAYIGIVAGIITGKKLKENRRLRKNEREEEESRKRQQKLAKKLEKEMNRENRREKIARKFKTVEKNDTVNKNIETMPKKTEEQTFRPGYIREEDPSEDIGGHSLKRKLN